MIYHTRTIRDLMTRKLCIYQILRTSPAGSENYLCASIELDAINAEIRRRERA